MRKINWPSLQNSNLVETTPYIPLAQMLYPREKERERRRRRLDLLASKNSKKDKIGTGQVSSNRQPPYFSLQDLGLFLTLRFTKRGEEHGIELLLSRFSNATLPDYRKLETPDKRVPFLLV